jgi:TonB family protein
MKSLKSILLVLVCFISLTTIAQNQTDNDTTIYSVVDEMPQFPGGDSAMVAYLTHNLHYPQTEKEKGIQGKVFVGFVVEKDGIISNVEVKKGIGEECDAEAVRVIKEMPTWNPGKQNSECVRVSLVLPINFKIIEQPQAPTIDTLNWVIIEKMPTFPGGEEALMDFIGTNIRYPKYAQDHGISGRVFIKFVVMPDGSVSNVEVLKGIGGGCDEEAVRVVKMMPKWIPGEKDGKKVMVMYTLPISFRLTSLRPQDYRR